MYIPTLRRYSNFFVRLPRTGTILYDFSRIQGIRVSVSVFLLVFFFIQLCGAYTFHIVVVVVAVAETLQSFYTWLLCGYACVCTAMFLNFLFSSFCRSVEYQNAHIQNAFFRPPYTRTHTETQIFAYLLPQTLHKLNTSYSIRCSKHMLRSKLARNIFMYILQGVEWPTRCHITLHKLTSSS